MKLSLSLPSRPNPIKPSNTFDAATAHQNGDVSEHSPKNSTPPRPRHSETDNSGGGVEERLLQKLKSDLEQLADHKGMEEYEGMPVEGYGAALLSGYGWHPGRGIGRNAKEDVKVVEYTKSTHRHGLGFHKNSKEIEKKKKIHVLLERILLNQIAEFTGDPSYLDIDS
ncbi:protein MOS2-like [Argentina anserina]|uniref:protein MOS2-like n=1 Tax=Argentina anserina TaxID=57926 RepID=UPI0021763697|nr:protein MOS2-like [Potentilla anserina]